MPGRATLFLLAALLPTLLPTPASASPPAPRWNPAALSSGVSIFAVDPLTVADDDFARNRDPALWKDLSVQSITFRENDVPWHLWHIANLAHRDGPLWVVPHDNENATFAAALIALRSWGGTMVVVDTGPADEDYAARFNAASGSAPVDPNRNFRDELPGYWGTVLADIGAVPQLIVALHTNARGFDPTLSACPAPGKTDAESGGGDISIRLCSDRLHPSASRRRAWPFDDDDSLVLLPYLANSDARSAYCGERLVLRDFNVMFERIAWSDGSLSNFAALHGLRYINIETRNRGSDASGIAEARNRLVAMTDAVMERCGDVTPLAIRPPPPEPPKAARSKRRRWGH